MIETINKKYKNKLMKKELEQYIINKAKQVAKYIKELRQEPFKGYDITQLRDFDEIPKNCVGLFCETLICELKDYNTNGFECYVQQLTYDFLLDKFPIKSTLFSRLEDELEETGEQQDKIILEKWNIKNNNFNVLPTKDELNKIYKDNLNKILNDENLKKLDTLYIPDYITFDVIFGDTVRNVQIMNYESYTLASIGKHYIKNSFGVYSEFETVNSPNILYFDVKKFISKFEEDYDYGLLVKWLNDALIIINNELPTKDINNVNEEIKNDIDHNYESCVKELENLTYSNVDKCVNEINDKHKIDYERCQETLKDMINSYKGEVNFDDKTGEIHIDGKKQIPFEKEFWFKSESDGNKPIITVDKIVNDREFLYNENLSKVLTPENIEFMNNTFISDWISYEQHLVYDENGKNEGLIINVNNLYLRPEQLKDKDYFVCNCHYSLDKQVAIYYNLYYFDIKKFIINYDENTNLHHIKTLIEDLNVAINVLKTRIFNSLKGE